MPAAAWQFLRCFNKKCWLCWQVMAYYISFLKTLSLKLNKHTIHFFYNEVFFLLYSCLNLEGTQSNLNCGESTIKSWPNSHDNCLENKNVPLIIFDLRSTGRRFKSYSWQSSITTLGKSFTPMCLCHQTV